MELKLATARASHADQPRAPVSTDAVALFLTYLHKWQHCISSWQHTLTLIMMPHRSSFKIASLKLARSVKLPNKTGHITVSDSLVDQLAIKTVFFIHLVNCISDIQ